MVPWFGARNANTVRSKVDLPAPFGPITSVISFGARRNAEAAQDVDARQIAGMHVLHGEESAVHCNERPRYAVITSSRRAISSSGPSAATLPGDHHGHARTDAADDLHLMADDQKRGAGRGSP